MFSLLGINSFIEQVTVLKLYIQWTVSYELKNNRDTWNDTCVVSSSAI